MSVQQLPLYPGEPHVSFQVELDGRIFGFRFDWNVRAQAWFLTFSDAEGVVLNAGMRLVVGSAFYTRFRPFDFPPGELELVDTSNRSADPTLDDIGRRVLMLYTPVSDLPPGYALSV